MKKTASLALLFALILPYTTAYTAWSRQCLEDCFSTRHDCNFCAYQCTVEPRKEFPYVSQLPCPLDRTEIVNY